MIKRINSNEYEAMKIAYSVVSQELAESVIDLNNTNSKNVEEKNNLRDWIKEVSSTKLTISRIMARQ